MQIFKMAFKTKRKDDNEIYKGFGFKHISDASQYYLHPDNESNSSRTILSQPIGEAISMLSSIFESWKPNSENFFGEIFSSTAGDRIFIEVTPPDDWKEKGIIPQNLMFYECLISDLDMAIAAYDTDGLFMESTSSFKEDMQEYYKFIPAFCAVLAQEIVTNPDFSALFLDYIKNPAADSFVNIHEDIYQLHKNDDYKIEYRYIEENEAIRTNRYSLKFKEMQAVSDTEIYRSKEIIKFPPGTFKSEYQWLIPQLTSEFQLPETMHSICSAVASGDCRALLCHGPSGTGKTMTCKLICRETNLPIMETINCTENLDEFVLGKFIPEGDKIIFKESYVTAAIREGGAVVFEEINFARPQYLAFLNSLLDDNGFVRLDNGEVVKRHPDFRFFATMNLGYFGTKELNQALYNRFNAIAEIASLADSAIARMLSARVPEAIPLIDKMLGVYHKIISKIESEELDIVISPRNLENWARIARYEGYVSAAEKTIIPIAKNDRILEDTIRGIIGLYRWNIASESTETNAV